MKRIFGLVAAGFFATAPLFTQQESLPTRLGPDEMARYEELSMDGQVSPLGIFGATRESELFETAGYTEIAEYLRHRERGQRTRFGISMFVMAGGFVALFTPAILLGEATPLAIDNPLGLTIAIAGGVSIFGSIPLVVSAPHYPTETREAVADEYNRWLIREIRAGRL
jgi:hypothetical protein